MARFLETQGTTTTTLTELFSARYLNTILGKVRLFDDCDARDPVRKVKAVPAAMALRLGSQGARVRLRASATSCKSTRAE